MNIETGTIAPGQARCPADSTQDIISRDKVTAPGWVRSENYAYLGSDDIDVQRYIDPAFAQEEYRRLWTRTWQFTCREEHIPNVGDYYVYDIGTHSFIVTRVSQDEIRAYFNACLHRGTKLRPSHTEGSAAEFKCPFHGWTWNLDGTNSYIPCRWDFPHVDPAKFSLPEARVELLGGFVWINMDPNAPDLASYLGKDALAHLTAWDLQNRYIHVHVQKSFPANWKLTVEAFLEAYHVIETHPQVAVSNADANSQYDIYDDHVNRFISPLGVVSPHLAGKYSEQDILDQFTIGDGTMLDADRPKLGEGTARQVMADMFRGMFEKATSSDLGQVSDSEILDCFSYTIFPNTYLFPGISLPMVYRFRPDPKDHRRCIYEVMFLRPVPTNGERPPPAEVVILEDHQSFAEAEGMDPGFGKILDQDTGNLYAQQEGLEATAKAGLTLGNYQEIRVRHFEKAVDKYLAMAPCKPELEALQRHASLT